MFRIYCLVLFLLSLETADAQAPILQWAKQFGSSRLEDTYNDNGRSIAVDADGNVYSVGIFNYTVDFDPGPGVYDMTAPEPYHQSLYISKLSPTGEFIWAEQLPVLIEGTIYLTLDKHANLYITAELRETADLDPGPGVYNVTRVGTKDAFVIKLNKNGELLWVKQFGGMVPDTVPFGSAIAVDENDNVIVCGGFNRLVDFDPGPATFNLTAVGTFEAFITKLSPDGNFIWAKKLGDFNSVYQSIGIEDVKCDRDGNIYTTGWFNGNCDFDPGGNTFNLVSGGPADGYVSKIDPNGNFVWAKKLGNSANNYVVQPRGIDIDGDNNVYTTGSFLGTQDFDPGNNVYSLTNIGAPGIFVVKLTVQGDFTWARGLGGTGVNNGFDVTVDNSNNVYVLGTFDGSVDFDPGPGVFLQNLYDAAAVVKFDANGNFNYASAFNRIIDGSSAGRRLVTDLAQNIYITGYFGGTVDFDPGPGTFILDEGRGWTDAFVLKLSKCTNVTTSNINVSTCDNYILNSVPYDTSGIYTQVIPNAAGCDSIITLNLTINRKYTTQVKLICEGEVFFAGGVNQTRAGIYRDTLQTSLGCDSVVVTNLTVHPKPALYLGPDRNLCLNTPITISPGVFSSYLWQNMSTQDSFHVNATGLYWVTVTDVFDCSATDSLRINSVIQPPANFLKQTDSICLYETLQLQPLHSFSNYLWSTGATEGSVVIQAPGNYWLRVADVNGCYGIDSVKVFSKECSTGIYIPTAFTPNGDGKNDLFKAIVYGKIKAFKLQVFDRAGQIIFQTVNPNVEWNGLNKGMAYSATSFVWQCFYQLEGGLPEYQKGTVILIR